MNAAAQTAGLPNASTGAERLLDLARWLVGLLIIHWIVTCGRRLAAALYKPSGPDDAFLAAHFGTTDRALILTRITRALHRAADLRAELLARSPIEQGYPIEVRRAIGARITDICCELGLFRSARTSVIACRTSLIACRTARKCGFPTRPCNATRTAPPCRRPTVATGPPYLNLAREAGEVVLFAAVSNTCERRTPTPAACPLPAPH